MDFISAVKASGVARKHSLRNDDLFVDRLNHRYTVVIICLFAMVISISQYCGAPINCWVPGHFTGNYADYAQNICWVSSTYNIPLNEDIPHNENDRKVKMLKYYQWTPFILLFQALLFYLPRMIWRSLNDKSGLDIQSLVDAVYSYHNDASKYNDKEILMNYLTGLFHHYVNSTTNSALTTNDVKFEALNERNNARKRIVNIQLKDGQEIDSDDDSELKNSFDDYYNKESLNKTVKTNGFKRTVSICKRITRILCITKGKRLGNYLLALFVFVKLLYTFNSLIQLFILNHFLGNDYLLLGFEVMSKIWNGDDWTQVKRFPRVTMCDFRIREVGIVHRYSVQCVLSINLFNEKIFIFLWFWCLIVSLFNVFDLFSWSYTLIINSHERYSYIKRRLAIINANNDDANISHDDKRLFKKFVNNYLREDGVLALRLLSRNSQDLIVSEIISNLFTKYKNQVKQQKNSVRNNVKEEMKNNVYTQENEIVPQEGMSKLDNLKHVHNTLHNTTVLGKQTHPYPNQN